MTNVHPRAAGLVRRRMRMAAFGRTRFGRPLFIPDMEPFGPATER